LGLAPVSIVAFARGVLALKILIYFEFRLLILGVGQVTSKDQHVVQTQHLKGLLNERKRIVESSMGEIECTRHSQGIKSQISISIKPTNPDHLGA
jgi:hypothetical protein